MMTKEDILRLRDTAEQTKVQFKERVTRISHGDRYCLGIPRCEVNPKVWTD